jgi:ADP-ribosylglycohydrolase
MSSRRISLIRSCSISAVSNAGPPQAVDVPEGFPPPLPNSYWVEPGRLLAGEYPGAASEEGTRSRLKRLQDAGIDCFIDLTMPDELEAYDRLLPGPHARRAASYLRQPIRDHGLPETAAQMVAILDAIDAALAQDRHVYLHCRAGIGRTNLVIGCWLARRGLGGPAALARLNELWSASARSESWPSVPETEAQADFVLAFRGTPAVRPAAATPGPSAGSLHARCRGLLLGLALGDALGQAAAGRRAGTFPALRDLEGGGPHALPAGAWSDKTAMALCLAASLTERDAVDPTDQLHRYLRWQKDGEWSSTGRCVGISAATARALATAQWSRNPFAGSHDPATADREPLARIGPVAAFLCADPAAAVAAAVDCVRVTHQAPVALEAARYFVALLVGALRGASKEELLAPLYTPVPGLWERAPLRPEIHAIALGAWRDQDARRSARAGQAAGALGLALRLFERGAGLTDCLLQAANLGREADANAAIVGQLAGACYGATELPAGWLQKLALRNSIETLAEGLWSAARRRGAGP